MDLRGTHIENLNVGSTVDGSANVDTLLLAARQRSTTLTDLGEVAIGEEIQVGIQARVGNCSPVSVRVERSTETDVLTNGSVLQFA